MQLTPAQKTSLKTHLNANTNHAIRGSDSHDFGPINTLLGQPFNGDALQAAADWYNALATAGDSQPFAVLMLWNPKVTTAQLNSAVNWPDNPAGADQATISNSWLKWQSMTWMNQIDMTDAQVRQGVLSVWGNPSATATNLGAIAGTLTGKIAGRRVELALSPAPVGAVAGAWVGAHVCPANVLGVTLQESDLEDLLLNG